MSIQIAKLAVESCFWPLYEIEHGKYKLSYRPANKVPAVDFMKPQSRFKHLFVPGNEKVLEKVQKGVDEEWEKLLALCGEK
jgi:pyruvate ferredoxin oxidoreductase beta subunit